MDYVLVGGMTMLQYVDGRNTREVALIVAPKDLARLPELVVSDQDNDFARADFLGVPVDLLFTANRLFKLIREKHQQNMTFARRSIACATPQGLLILKLFALPSLYRQGDNPRAAIYEADIAGLLDSSETKLDGAFVELEPHLLATDISELRKITKQIGARAAAFHAKIQNPKSKID